MLRKNQFDKNDPMLDAIRKITDVPNPMRTEYVNAAEAAGREGKGLPLEQRKEVYKKHMRLAQQESGQMLPADQFATFDDIANRAMGD